MKRYLLLFSLTCYTLFAQAQLLTSYEFKVKIHGISDTTLLLAHHYGAQQYVIDTVKINSKGEAMFSGTDTLPGGIYLCVAPSLKNKYFEFIVSGNEPKFSMETDTVDFIAHMKITGSLENTLFFQDLNFITDKKNEINVLRDKLVAAGEISPEGEKIKEEMRLVNNSVETERDKIISNYPNLFYSTFLKAVTDIKIPDAPLNADGTKDSTFAIRYIRAHYFDNVDFTDERLLRTNMYDIRIKKYLHDYVQKTPDSIDVAIDFILDKAKVNKYTFQFITVMLLNDYANSKFMGFDAVYVYMVDKYYSTGKAFWLDDVGLYRIQAQADKIRPILIGKQAPPLILQDTLNNDIALYSLKNRFTVIIFWSPDCGHCKKDMPKFEKLYTELAPLDVEFYTVYSEEEFDKWEKWLREHPYTWISVANKKLKETFQVKYNVDQTPMIFILDKDKKIVGKKIGVDQIKEVIMHQMEIENPK